MSIKDLAEKIKPFYSVLFFIVIASIFFALGRLSAIEERYEPIKIIQPASQETANAISAVINNSSNENGVESQIAAGEVIGSRTSKKYYLPWCSTVKRIKPENQVKFSSIDLAKASGYTAGGNCKGIQ